MDLSQLTITDVKGHAEERIAELLREVGVSRKRRTGDSAKPRNGGSGLSMLSPGESCTKGPAAGRQLPRGTIGRRRIDRFLLRGRSIREHSFSPGSPGSNRGGRGTQPGGLVRVRRTERQTTLDARILGPQYQQASTPGPREKQCSGLCGEQNSPARWAQGHAGQPHQ